MFDVSVILFSQGGVECRLRRAAIAGQQIFIEKLVKLAKLVARESGSRPKKVWFIIKEKNIVWYDMVSYIVIIKARYDMLCYSN